MKNKNSDPNVKTIAMCAVTGAVYAVLTIILSPISYGPIQARISEVLCILPFFIPETAWGLAAGCMIANFMTGNLLDVIFGSLATLAAGLAAASIGRKGKTSLKNKISACSMPVIFNAFIIGAVILCAYNGKHLFGNFSLYILYVLEIGIGEAIVMFAGGLPLMKLVPRLKMFSAYIDF